MRKLEFALLGSIGLLAAGCGGGGGGGGGGGSGTGNPAIDATLAPLYASMLSGSSTIDATITSGTIANPLQNSASSQQNVVNLGGQTNDGTVPSVTVSTSVQPKSDGSATATATVVEPGSGFTFLTVTQQTNAPGLSVRVPPDGLKALKADGTGHAFIILRVTTNGSFSRTLNNTSSTGLTLFNFTGVSTPPASGTVTQNQSGYQDVLLDYIISGLSGNLSAKLNAISKGSLQITATRTNGPATSPLNQNYSQLAVGALTFPANSDAIVAVGGDSGLTPNVGSNDAVNMNFSLSGGITGTTPSTDVGGTVTPQLNNSGLTTITYAGTLNNIQANDGAVQIDQGVSVSSFEAEDPAATIKSSLQQGNVLSPLGDPTTILYIPNDAAVSRRIYLIR